MTGFTMRRLLCVVLFASACGPIAGLAGKEKVAHLSQTTSVFDRAPASASRLRNPFYRQPDAAVAGRKLFLRHCAQCHGEKAEGGRNAPALRSDRVREAPDGVLYWFLKEGNLRAGMPSWSGLPPAQRWQIVSFLRSLR